MSETRAALYLAHFLKSDVVAEGFDPDIGRVRLCFL
jgi:hypothetical protein